MPAFRTTRRVAFTPRQMFDLVADVERYPQFLPLCEGLTVRKREREAARRRCLICEMTVGYKAIRETFTSRVTLDPVDCWCTHAGRCLSIRAGPFRQVENRWSLRRGAGRVRRRVLYRSTTSSR